MIWLIIYLVGIPLTYFVARWAHLNGFSGDILPVWRTKERITAAVLSLLSWFFFVLVFALFFATFVASKYDYRNGKD